MSQVVCISCGWQAYILCCSDLPLIETVCKACILQFSFKGKEQCQSCHKSIIHKIAKMKSEIIRQSNSLANEEINRPLRIFPQKKSNIFSSSSSTEINLNRMNSNIIKDSGVFMKKDNNHGIDSKIRTQTSIRHNPFLRREKSQGQSKLSDILKAEVFDPVAILEAIRYSDEVLNLPPNTQSRDYILQKKRQKMGNPFTQHQKPVVHFDLQSQLQEESSQAGSD